MLPRPPEDRKGLLTGKYKYGVETAKGYHFDGTTEERDGMFNSGMEGGMNESFAALDALLERAH